MAGAAPEARAAGSAAAPVAAAAAVPMPPPAAPVDPSTYTARERPANAYVAGVLNSAPTMTLERAKTAFQNLPHDGCARKAFLWSSLVGTMLGLHRLKQGGGGRAITHTGMLGFGFTFVTQFYLCRQHEFDTMVAMREYAARQAAVMGDDPRAVR